MRLRAGLGSIKSANQSDPGNSRNPFFSFSFLLLSFPFLSANANPPWQGRNQNLFVFLTEKSTEQVRELNNNSLLCVSFKARVPSLPPARREARLDFIDSIREARTSSR